MLPGKTYTPEDLLRLAWRRKWIIVIPFVLVTTATMIGLRYLPDWYRSETLILVVPQRVPDSYVRATEEAFGGLWPGDFGGNMDASDVREGVTVYLPIFHEGAYFYFGDFHALQGDGEIAGSGLESTADVTLQFDLIKGKRIRWPRLEDADNIMVAGSIRPLGDALRIAYVELIQWLVDEYGFDKMEAYQVVSQGGTARIANMVDPNHTVIARFPKSALPPKR